MEYLDSTYILSILCILCIVCILYFMYSISFIFIVYLCNTKSFTMTILVVLVCFFLLVFLVAVTLQTVDICDQYQMPLIRHTGKFLCLCSKFCVCKHGMQCVLKVNGYDRFKQGLM